MGLEDAARQLNVDRQTAKLAADHSAHQERQRRAQPVINSLSVELAGVLKKAGWRPGPFYRWVRPHKWENVGSGWSIIKRIPDNDARAGYVPEPMFLLGVDGSLWRPGGSVRHQKAFDGVGKSGGVEASEAYDEWAQETQHLHDVFTRIAAAALRGPENPKYSSTILLYPGDY